MGERLKYYVNANQYPLLNLHGDLVLKDQNVKIMTEVLR